MNKPVANFVPTDKITALMQKGRKQGYLTIEEIIDVFPTKSIYEEHLDDIVQLIEDMKIEVIR